MNQSKPPGPPPSSSAAAAQDLWLAGLDALAKATQAASQAATQAASQVATMAANAAAQPQSLEGLFEARVAKALGRLGTPTREEVDALSAQVQHLQAALQAALKSKSPATQPAVKKPPVKKASPARPRTTRP